MEKNFFIIEARKIGTKEWNECSTKFSGTPTPTELSKWNQNKMFEYRIALYTTSIQYIT